MGPASIVVVKKTARSGLNLISSERIMTPTKISKLDVYPRKSSTLVPKLSFLPINGMIHNLYVFVKKISKFE